MCSGWTLKQGFSDALKRFYCYDALDASGIIMKGQTYIQLSIVRKKKVMYNFPFPFLIYRLPEVKDEKKSRRHSIIGIGFDIPKLVSLLIFHIEAKCYIFIVALLVVYLFTVLYLML